MDLGKKTDPTLKGLIDKRRAAAMKMLEKYPDLVEYSGYFSVLDLIEPAEGEQCVKVHPGLSIVLWAIIAPRVSVSVFFFLRATVAIVF